MKRLWLAFGWLIGFVSESLGALLFLAALVLAIPAVVLSLVGSVLYFGPGATRRRLLASASKYKAEQEAECAERKRIVAQIESDLRAIRAAQARWGMN